MTHLINRLQFEINCPDEEHAFSLRHNFAITFQEQIAQVVDKICSKYVNEEQWLQIDRLEIDLGRFSPHSFEKDFTEVFKKKFEVELTQKLFEISPAQKEVSKQLSKIELFQYFLQKGILPWWADKTQLDLDDLCIGLLLDQPEIVKIFLYRNRFEKSIWLRLALQLSGESKIEIISLFEELMQAKQLLNDWIDQILLFRNTVQPERVIVEENIDNIVLQSAPQIFEKINGPWYLFQILENNIEKIFSEERAQIEEIIRQNKTIFFQNGGTYTNSTNEEDPAISDTGLNATPIDQVFSAVEPEAEVIEKYLVAQAGIILLAPFLKSFFTNLDFLQGVEWKDKAAQYKAVHLLRFLSTGEQKTPEYNLTLEKIICGISIGEPIPVEVSLHERETLEAELLLGSVIEHWKALKNTSVNGLREAFLKRDGLVKKKEDNWLLQVERKTLDVLVDSIPWGYSTVSLPWNDYLIFVEW